MLAGKIENRDYSVLVKLLYGKKGDWDSFFLMRKENQVSFIFKDGEIVGAVPD
ncbi:MAG: hypothetical protein R2883_01925 [Caldisericia bacterium]